MGNDSKEKGGKTASTINNDSHRTVRSSTSTLPVDIGISRNSFFF